MKICFATEVTYPNYVNRIKKSSLHWFLEKGMDKQNISYYISTNQPNEFGEYQDNDKIKVFDIEDLRIGHDVSKEYELYPENPVGLYPSRYPWNARRFIIEKAAQDGFDYVVYIDADVVSLEQFTSETICEVLERNYEVNTVQTNSTVFKYVNKAPADVFEHHEKYIEYFNLNFDVDDYDTIDGPVQVFIGETNQDILRFIENWHKFTDFGYKKEFGYGYDNNKHGNLSFVIPLSNFKLKWKGFPFHPHHNYEDRY